MVAFPFMSELTIAVETGRASMEEIRPVLDASLKEEFPGGMLKWRWEGDVMHLSGPGAKATIVLEDGRLVGRAELGPPASLMRPVIEQKITRAMKKAAD
jgi:Putative polyhydroxyalkanoic acid system protein (PHA_gran_rgn)